MEKPVYKVIQDLNDWDDPNGAYAVIDVANNIVVAEFDFKLEAQEFIKELKKKNNGKVSHSV